MTAADAHRDVGVAPRPLRAVSALDALVESLRDRILDGEFVPGEPLSDVELASEYGVARPTLRAAVQELTHEGLMRREPRRRACVPRLTAEDIRDLYFVRIPLELRAVEAITGRESVLGPAVQAVEHFERLGPEASWRDVVDADMRFHTALIGATGSLRLQRAYASLQAEIRLVRAQLRFPGESSAFLAEEHRQLLEAILAGPTRVAVRGMREHLERAADDLVGSA
jgi:DNA-binding GntR family transcriptional regulator